MIKYIILLNLFIQLLKITEYNNPNSGFNTVHTKYNEQVVKTILEKLKTCETVLNETFTQLGNSNEFQTLKSLLGDAIEEAQACLESRRYTNRNLRMKINKITKTISELTPVLEYYFDISQRE